MTATTSTSSPSPRRHNGAVGCIGLQMFKPLLHMGCDLNTLDDEMHRAHSNFKAVIAMGNVLAVSPNSDLWRRFAVVLGKSLVSAARDHAANWRPC